MPFEAREKEVYMRKFEVGQQYSARSICSHDCVWTYVVKARTDKMITLVDTDNGKTKKCRVNAEFSAYRGAETVFPLGRYSMAPMLSA